MKIKPIAIEMNNLLKKINDKQIMYELVEKLVSENKQYVPIEEKALEIKLAPLEIDKYSLYTTIVIDKDNMQIYISRLVKYTERKDGTIVAEKDITGAVATIEIDSTDPIVKALEYVLNKDKEDLLHLLIIAEETVEKYKKPKALR